MSGILALSVRSCCLASTLVGASRATWMRRYSSLYIIDIVMDGRMSDVAHHAMHTENYPLLLHYHSHYITTISLTTKRKTKILISIE